MANPNPPLANLRHFKPKWQSPTTAIRVPEKYKDACLTLARGLESGDIPEDWYEKLHPKAVTEEGVATDCSLAYRTYRLRGQDVIRVEDLVAAGILKF